MLFIQWNEAAKKMRKTKRKTFFSLGKVIYDHSIVQDWHSAFSFIDKTKAFIPTLGIAKSTYVPISFAIRST